MVEGGMLQPVSLPLTLLLPIQGNDGWACAYGTDAPPSPKQLAPPPPPWPSIPGDYPGGIQMANQGR